MSASYGGAFSSLTLFGPPEIIMALYPFNLLALVSSGNKSDRTFNSRTRLSITYHSKMKRMKMKTTSLKSKINLWKFQNAIFDNEIATTTKEIFFEKEKKIKLTFPYWAPASKIATEVILSILFDVFLFPIVESLTRLTFFSKNFLWLLVLKLKFYETKNEYDFCNKNDDLMQKRTKNEYSNDEKLWMPI